MCKADSQNKLNNSLLSSTLCDYSDACRLVK